MTKNFHLFGWDVSDRNSGPYSDYIGAFETREEAIEYARNLRLPMDNYQVLTPSFAPSENGELEMVYSELA